MIPADLAVRRTQPGREQERKHTMDIQPPLILLVDNDPDALEILRCLLDMVISHAEIVAVESGTAALAVLAKRAVALMITDYSMPTMNGVQLTRAVKAAWPATRVAIASAEKRSYVESMAKAIAADYLLPKPYRLALLQQIIEESIPSSGTRP